MSKIQNSTESTVTSVEQSDLISLALGTIPTADAYAAADQSGKAKIRSDVDKIMKSALRAVADDAGWVAVAVAAAAALASYGPSTAPAVTVDWSAKIAGRVATLRYAADLLESGAVRPANVPDSFTYEVPDESDWSAVDRSAAVTLAGARVGRSGRRGNVADHITEVLSEAGVGVRLTVSMIANKITEAYPADGPRPSDGAVAARLFGKSGCTVDGVEAFEATATQPRSAALVEEEATA